MRQKITKLVVEKMRPGETVWDTEVTGLAIRFQTRDKVFYFKTRLQGRQRWIAIGKHNSPLTVEAARDRARSLMGKIIDGATITDLRKPSAPSPTVAELAERYLSEHARPYKKVRSVENDEANLVNHVVPKLGRIPVAEVDREAIEKFLLDIAEGRIAAKQPNSRQGLRGGATVSGGRGVSNRCRALLSKMFSLAERWRIIPQNSNPVTHTAKFRERSVERFLSDEELCKLGSKLQKIERTHPYHVAAYRLLLLTGARMNEILSLRWEYVDLQRKLLLLPDSKTGKKAVPLSDAAVKILRKISRAENNPHVIVGHKRGSHLVNIRKQWFQIRAELDFQDVRIHDLRHTYASNAIASGVPLALVGRLLGHKHNSTTERYAHIANSPLLKASELAASSLSTALLPQRRKRRSSNQDVDQS